MFFQRRHTGGQQACENMLNITNHQGNQIKTKMRYHLTPARMDIISVHFLSHIQLFVTPWTAAHQASLSITNSQSLHKLM